MQLKFRAFRAVSDPDACLQFREAHRNVLRDYGITNITTNTDRWMHHPGTYCLVARSADDDKIVGGVRIQISDEATPLPVEMAIGEMDRAIHQLIVNLRNAGGVGELCALWNARSVSGMGVSLLLVRAIVASSNQLPITTLVCICADYTLQMFKNVGFIVDNSLGLNGEFPYPNVNYTARVLGIMDPHSLDAATEVNRLRMQSLRENPQQHFTESGAVGKIDAEYDLTFKK